MARTKVPVELSSTPGITDSSNATAITIDSSEDVTLAGHLVFADSKNIKIGAGTDLQLYHDGTNTYITNATGALKVATETRGIAISIRHTTSETTVPTTTTTTTPHDFCLFTLRGIASAAGWPKAYYTGTT